MSKRKIIVDTDPGYDDACAIALAGLSDKFELIGITSVAGNQTIDKVTKNALNLASYFNISAPVAKGSSGPLIKPLEVAVVHGKSGLDNIDFQPHNKVIHEKNAVNFIIDSCLSNEKISIITIGPLTNVALALKLCPEIKSHIDVISIMGGSANMGNVTPAAEFNIYADPEAAHIVLSSGVKIKLNTLDVTLLTTLNDGIMERFEKIGTKSSKLFIDINKNYARLLNENFGIKFGSMHDSVAVITLIDESIVKYKKAKVEVDLSHGCSYGRTNCNFHIKQGIEDSNVEVSVEIDVDKFWNTVEEIYKKY
jgi:ribosylpyrimidine nucleosidase